MADDVGAGEFDGRASPVGRKRRAGSSAGSRTPRWRSRWSGCASAERTWRRALAGPGMKRIGSEVGAWAKPRIGGRSMGKTTADRFELSCWS